MRLWLLAATVVSAVVASQQAYVERECPCTLSSLWVDVVVAVDISNGMGSSGVTQVAGDVLSVFIQSTISQQRGQVSRVGVVTYSSDYNSTYDMNYFTSTDQLTNEIWGIIPNGPTQDTSYVKKGLQGAVEMLGRGRSGGKRSNVKQAIIVFASDYKGTGDNDPHEIADNIKTSGIKLITVAFDQGGESRVLNGLKELASPGMGFSSTDADSVGEVQGALCQTNCFCPSSWMQYSNSYGSTAKVYGECLRMGEIAASWTPAKYTCQNLAKGGFLATEFSRAKHDFLYALAKHDSTFAAPHQYSIGLSMSGGKWKWEQGMGKTQITLQSSFIDWLPGYPTTGNSCVMNAPNSTSESTIGWTTVNCNTVSKRYICQVTTCDTDNYCA